MSRRNDPPARDRYRGKWPGILAALGVEHKMLNKRNQPCPFCGGKDRFRWTNHQDDGGYYCSGCEPGDGLTFVQKYLKLNFKEAVERIDAIIGEVRVTPMNKDPNKQVERARAIWDAALPVTEDSPVGRYLRNRGYELTFPNVRYVERLRHIDETVATFAPAMVCKIMDAEGYGVGIHRTWLTTDGFKAPLTPCRASMGSLPAGAAIRLFKATPRLGIAEGVETALRAAQRFGLPVWSAISEGGLRKFVVPEGVTELVIFGDNDRNFVGQAAAFHLANRALLEASRAKRPLTVRVEIPPRPGSDWADPDQSDQAVAA